MELAVRETFCVCGVCVEFSTCHGSQAVRSHVAFNVFSICFSPFTPLPNRNSCAFSSATLSLSLSTANTTPLTVSVSVYCSICLCVLRFNCLQSTVSLSPTERALRSEPVRLHSSSAETALLAMSEKLHAAKSAKLS